MLEAIRATIRELLAQRSGHEADIDKIIASAEGRGEGALTGAEERSFRDAKHAVNLIDAELRAARAREADLVGEQAVRDEAAKLRSQYPPLKGGGMYGTSYSGGFVRDAVAKRFGNDPAAEARLNEHQLNRPGSGGDSFVWFPVRPLGRVERSGSPRIRWGARG